MENNEKYFNNLNIGLLNEFSVEWVNLFPDIKFEKIELRRYSTIKKYAPHYRAQPTTLYAIVFHTLETDEDLSKLADEEKHKLHMDQITGKKPLSPFQRFVAATQYRHCVGQKDFKALIDSGFRNVYLSTPDTDYLKEWTFIPLAKGEKVPLSVNTVTSPVILYPDPISELVAFNDDSFLPDGLLIDECQDRVWQINAADWAIRNGFISSRKLVCIMANDVSYIPILPILWTKFQMNIMGNDCPSPLSFDSRIDIWTALFNRWHLNEVLGLNFDNKKILEKAYGRNFERFDKNKILIDSSEKKENDNDTLYISLTELKNYLLEVAKIHLPAILFPEEFENQNSNMHKEDDVDALTLKYGIAAEKLYDCMTNKLKALGKNLSNAEKTDMRDAAISEFENHPEAFHPLKKHHIEGDAIYAVTEKQKRQTVGIIIMGALSYDSRAEKSYQKLYARFQALKSR